MTGVVHPDNVVTNAAARAGDALVLTKPIGTGTPPPHQPRERLHRWRKRRGVMTTLNARRQRGTAAGAGTDVTGFGLLGPPAELALASGVAAEVDAAAVPAIEGVVELLSDPEERAVAGGYTAKPGACRGVRFVSRHGAGGAPTWLVCDAMTSGGPARGGRPGRGELAARRGGRPAGRGARGDDHGPLRPPERRKTTSVSSSGAGPDRLVYRATSRSTFVRSCLGCSLPETGQTARATAGTARLGH